MSATVIVPTHRGADRIGALLDSLAAQSAAHQVLVVDNGSDDGTVEVLRRYPDVEVIRLEGNIGFGPAVNLAAQRADGEALVLVNDDSVCDSGFVEAITRPLAGEVVMSAGVMRDQADQHLIDTAGMELASTLLVFDYLHGESLEVLASARTPVGPSGAAAAFDRGAFLGTGGFDEVLFAYWEDVDLVLRLRLAGGKCALAADALGTHLHSATLGAGSATKNRLMGFGRAYVLRKWSVMRSRHALRALAEDTTICLGQALIDGNVDGLAGRVRGWRAARSRFGYPSAAVAGHPPAPMPGDLRRRLRRRRRTRRLRLPAESPREGFERELGAGSLARHPGRGFAAELAVPGPGPLGIGAGNVVFLGGRLIPPSSRPARVELLLDGEACAEPVTVVDPAGGGPAFWWTTTRIEPVGRRLSMEVALRSRDGAGLAALGALTVEPALATDPSPEYASVSAAIASSPGRPRVVICMATYEPEERLFAEQVQSIKAQTHPGWACLISDDGSSAEALEAMREAIGGDRRFVLLEHDRRLGFYANFERALAAVPPEAELVALADQDDRWYPDKLEALIGGLGDRDLVYGDMRIVDGEGAVISETYWSRRRNNYTDLASLLVGNTVTGAAAMFRSELLGRALPFPPRRGKAYHDHWIALTAMTGRGLAYVDRPLQDYVQHGGAAQGYEEANAGAGYLQLRTITYLGWHGLSTLLGRPAGKGWAARYFGMYLRTAIWARVLLIRSPDSLGRSQRRILRRISDPQGSLAAMTWLGARSLRPLWGANEAFGRELIVFTSVLWIRALQARSRLSRALPRGYAIKGPPPPGALRD